ncbi:hypothetical protein BDV93DRAFT_517880 [Ceratobasidium sp. AG-I]|nr:hypothetical protein BDV93DRAFT_517880 [Ceratobasidium sp. AG-I]
MADAPLHPIIIGAILTGQFECLGDGLLHDGVEREQPNTLKDLLVPTKTSKRTPMEDRERPKKWWRAQCIHYALPAPASAPISTYRVHLENAIRQRGGLKRPQDLADLEFEQNTKFRRLNAEVRSATQGNDQAKAPKKSKATKPAPAPAPAAEPIPAKAKAKAEPKPKAEPKVKAEPKAKAEPKVKAETKTKAEPKAKAEPNPKAELKTKAKAAPLSEPAVKATASKKRKADTVVHVYHYDGDRVQEDSKEPGAKQERVKPPPAKKARTKAPAPASAPAPTFESSFDGPPSYSQIEDRPGPSLSQTIRKGIPGMYSGTYELECTSENNWPSYEKPTLQVFMSKSGQPLFQGLLILPDLLTCLLRLKPKAPAPEDGYLRFEWCGREEGEGQIEPPMDDNVGWLKMHKSEGRVKGMIQTTFGEFLFQGPRVDANAPVIEYEWEDFSWDAHGCANRARW